MEKGQKYYMGTISLLLVIIAVVLTTMIPRFYQYPAVEQSASIEFYYRAKYYANLSSFTYSLLAATLLLIYFHIRRVISTPQKHKWKIVGLSIIAGVAIAFQFMGVYSFTLFTKMHLYLDQYFLWLNMHVILFVFYIVFILVTIVYSAVTMYCIFLVKTKDKYSEDQLIFKQGDKRKRNILLVLISLQVVVFIVAFKVNDTALSKEIVITKSTEQELFTVSGYNGFGYVNDSRIYGNVDEYMNLKVDELVSEEERVRLKAEIQAFVGAQYKIDDRNGYYKNGDIATISIPTKDIVYSNEGDVFNAKFEFREIKIKVQGLPEWEESVASPSKSQLNIITEGVDQKAKSSDENQSLYEIYFISENPTIENFKTSEREGFNSIDIDLLRAVNRNIKDSNPQYKLLYVYESTTSKGSKYQCYTYNLKENLDSLNEYVEESNVKLETEWSSLDELQSFIKKSYQRVEEVE